jgi:hypothetical protein
MQMHAYTEEELARLEAGPGSAIEKGPLVTSLLSETTMAVPLAAATRSSVLRELVRLAEKSWHLYDAQAILEAIKQREELVVVQSSIDT